MLLLITLARGRAALSHSYIGYRSLLYIGRPNLPVAKGVLYREVRNDISSILHKGFSSFLVRHNKQGLSDYEGLKEKLTDPKTIQLKTPEHSQIDLPAFSNRIYTIPNMLTMTRLISAPAIGYFITQNEPHIAIYLFVYSCVTDLVDGIVARKFNQGSVLGSILDPMADKLLMTVCTLSLAYTNTILIPVASIIIGRDVLLSFMAFYYRYVSLDEPKTLKRFVDLSIPSASVRPNLLSKFNTAVQMIYLGGLVLRPGIEGFLGQGALGTISYIFLALEIFVCITTILSGLTYLLSKDAIVFLKKGNQNLLNGKG